MPQAKRVFTAFTPVTKPEPGSGLMRVIQVSASQDCVSFVVAAGFYERNFTGRFYDLSNRVLAQCCYSTDFPAYAEILPLISPLVDDSYSPSVSLAAGHGLGFARLLWVIARGGRASLYIRLWFCGG